MDDNRERAPVTFLPTGDESFRWLPRHGGPFSVAEWMSQRIVRSLAFAPVYTAVIVTAILAIQVFHPFGLGKG